MPEAEDMRVQLARMEGKLDMSNLRHEQVDKRLADHEQRLHRHSTDISNLQAAEHLRVGERKGAIGAGRLMWAAISFIIGSGGVFALLELLK